MIVRRPVGGKKPQRKAANLFAHVLQCHTKKTTSLNPRLRVVTKAIRSLDWVELVGSQHLRRADLLWFMGVGEPLLSVFMGLGPGQRLNRLPSMAKLMGKVELARMFYVLEMGTGRALAHVPATLTAGVDGPVDRAMRAGGVPPAPRCNPGMTKGENFGFVLVKPDRGRAGEGIEIVGSWEAGLEAGARLPSVVQEYLARPLLLDGLKFDLRIYVLVLDWGVFVFSEGMARLCTSPYEPPTEANRGDLTRHLSNFAINKVNADGFVEEPGEDGEQATKQTLTNVIEGIASRLGRKAASAVLTGVDSAVAETVAAFLPSARANAAAVMSIPSNAFHLLGFDIIVGESPEGVLSCYVLEANTNPSLASGLQVDWDIKEPLVRDTLRLAWGGQGTDPGRFRDITALVRARERGSLSSPRVTAPFAKYLAEDLKQAGPRGSETQFELSGEGVQMGIAEILHMPASSPLIKARLKPSPQGHSFAEFVLILAEVAAEVGFDVDRLRAI